MLRLSSGRRGSTRPGRLVACATSPTTGATVSSGATIGKRPVVATAKATTVATNGATVGSDYSTAHATTATATSAPCSRRSLRPAHGRVDATSDHQHTAVAQVLLTRTRVLPKAPVPAGAQRHGEDRTLTAAVLWRAGGHGQASGPSSRNLGPPARSAAPQLAVCTDGRHHEGRSCAHEPSVRVLHD